MHIGKAIKYYRCLDRYMFQKTLSLKMGKHEGFIYQLEVKKAEFNIYTLLELCKIFNVKLSEFITKAEEYE